MSTSIVNTSNINIISKNVVEYAEQFKGYAVKTAESIIQMAKVVIDAKNTLGAIDYEEFCNQVGYKSDSSTIRKLKSIGEKYEILLARSKSLPSNWTTIYQVSRLTSDLIDQKIDEGVITPSLDGKNLPVRLGLTAAKEDVPKGTVNTLTLKVNFDLIPSPKLKAKLQNIIKELEVEMKAKVEKSASLEEFLKETQNTLAKSA
jgi:hypothetical protein